MRGAQQQLGLVLRRKDLGLSNDWAASLAGILMSLSRHLCYSSTMMKMTARDANQSFSRMLAAVEKGEVVLITKNGKTVAELRPRVDDPRDDPEWRRAYERMMALMKSWPDTGYRVGRITEDDKYGDAPP